MSNKIITIPNAKSERIIEIDYLRGLAIILIVFGHAIISFPIDLNSIPWCHYLKRLVYCFHVPALFLVAGFCYHCSKYKTFISNKCKRILVPYLIFGFFWSLLHIFASSLTDPRNPTDLSSIILSFFNGGGYWFLWVLFLIFLTWPLLEKIYSNKIVWMFFFLILKKLEFTPEIFRLNALIPCYVYFIIGTILSTPNIKQKIFNSSIRQKKMALCLSLLSVIIAVSIYGIEKEYGFPIRSLCFISFVGSLILLLTPYLKKYYLGNILSKLLITSSCFSLQLYLFDSYWQTAGRTLLCTLLKINNPIIIISFIFITNMVLSLLICNYILPKIPLLQKVCGIVQK